jgi:hypothetical protein
VKVVITVGELIDKDLWFRAAELLGVSEYAVNEGQVSSDHQVWLSPGQAFELGLIKMNDDYSIEIVKEGNE